MEQDNCSLAALVCKVRSLGRWRLAAQQERFRGQLSKAEKVRLGEEGGLLPFLAAAAALVSGSKI